MGSIKKIIYNNREIIAYIFWGGMTTVVSWGSYSILTMLFAGINKSICLLGRTVSLEILLASLLSWICAVAFAFFTNKLWVFNSKTWERTLIFKEVIAFISSRLATGAIEVLGVPLLVLLGMKQTVFGIEGMVAKMVISIFVVILNYVLSKWLVFNTGSDDNMQ